MSIPAGTDAHFWVETRHLSSRYLNGTLMYPGRWRFVWARVAKGTWMLTSIDREDERSVA